MTLLDETLQISAFRIDDVAVVVVRGEIDTTTAQSLRATFNTLRHMDHVYVDCAGVVSIDRSGMRVLEDLAARNVAAGAPLHMLASAEVRRRIEIAGLEQLFSLD